MNCKYAKLPTSGWVFIRGDCGIALLSLGAKEAEPEGRDSVRKMLEVTTAKRRDGISDYKYHVI